MGKSFKIITNVIKMDLKYDVPRLLNPEEEWNISLGLDVPSYINDGKYPFQLIIDGEIMNNSFTISQDMMIVVFSSDKSWIITCLLEVNYKISNLDDAGENTIMIREIIEAAEAAFASQDYVLAQNGCEEIVL